jgi:Rieske Fe-S protein
MERRTFLKWATHRLGALFGALLGIPAVAYLIDPRNRAAPRGDFKTVARLSELEPDVPTQVVIRALRQDAWALYPSEVIGRAWLIRRDGDKVDAFTTICPHLGCSVNYEKEAKLFICPCHNGTFEMTGRRKENTATTNPAPRGMDALDVQLPKDPDPAHEVDDPANPGQKKADTLIVVKYQSFYQGKPEKVPKV